MTASALTLHAPQSTAATAPAHAPADTINTQLLKSVNELSKPASNLSEALLKIIDAKGGVPAGRDSSEATDTVKASTESLPEATIRENGIFISDEADIIEAASDSVWFLPADKQPGGMYIWIPDENVTAVKALLNGGATAASTEPAPAGAINLNEMTFWRGDSIPMALPTKRLGRYDRKLYT